MKENHESQLKIYLRMVVKTYFILWYPNCFDFICDVLKCTNSSPYKSKPSGTITNLTQMFKDDPDRLILSEL